MAAAVKDSFLDLERHRQLLENNVEKLRQSLQQWQLWDAEYEALKEEVTSLPKPAERADLARIRRDFDGQLVTRKEVDELFGRVELKPADQIVNVLSRRIDYTAKNVETLEKQLEAAENKLAAATVISQPDSTHEDGEQVMDIVEQLDDDDNVISSRVHTPSNIQPQLLEALRKAGIKDLPDGDSQPAESVGEDDKGKGRVKEITEEVASAPQAPETEAEPSSLPIAKKKKGVSFADDTKYGDEDADSEADAPRSRAAQRLEQIMQTAKEQENLVASSSVRPEDESAEDTALRQEMLEYSMSEIGPVVAELSIEDGLDDEDDYEFEYTDDEGDEDNYGRTNYSIDEEYRERMLELQEKLGVQSAFTQGSVPREGMGRISIQPSGDAQGAPVSEAAPVEMASDAAVKPEKKSVKFSEQLDIAPQAAAPVANQQEKQNPAAEALVEPLSDIVERTKPATPVAEKSTKKPSRFKSVRAGVASTTAPATETPIAAASPKGPQDAPVRFLDEDKRVAPSGPEGQTIADAVMERQTSGTREPDDMNATLLHQETAVEYHRRRNRLIQDRGGFLKEDESATTPLDDDEEAGRKRVSRFKAARLSKQ